MEEFSRKEMGNYLFGEIDVPSLEKSDSPLEPYDTTRRLKLNPKHPTARILIAFIAGSMDIVRQELVKSYREQQKSLEARRLAQEAQKIAEILNSDFREWQQRLDDIRVASSSNGPISASFGGSPAGEEGSMSWIAGEEEPGSVTATSQGRLTGDGRGRPAPDIPRAGSPDDRGESSVNPVGADKGNRRRPTAGFHVDYRHLGSSEQDRSRYDPKALTILINLDHPAVRAALDDSGIEGISFRRLSYEIAFAEYAFALEYHFLDQDPDKPAADAIYDVRDTLNRIAASAAELYR